MTARADKHPFAAPSAVFVMGPTASGKSEFAFRLAESVGGAVISADSMQIYRRLDIGTAKESAERRAVVPHYMIDVVDPDEEFSVAEYREGAFSAAKEAENKGLLPIFVGGTGLYFESLFYPLSFGDTEKDDTLRRELSEEAAKRGAEFMHAKLAALDAATAQKLHPNDKKRVIRALEVVISSGKPLSAARDRSEDPDVIAVMFDPSDRKKLYERIDARTDAMFSEGLPEEIAALSPDFSLQSMQAIGYKEFAPYADRIKDGKLEMTDAELAEVRELIKKHTRNYAKRQLTWFRRYAFAARFDVGDFDGAMSYVIKRLGDPAEKA